MDQNAKPIPALSLTSRALIMYAGIALTMGMFAGLSVQVLNARATNPSASILMRVWAVDPIAAIISFITLVPGIVVGLRVKNRRWRILTLAALANVPILLVVGLTLAAFGTNRSGILFSVMYLGLTESAVAIAIGICTPQEKKEPSAFERLIDSVPMPEHLAPLDEIHATIRRFQQRNRRTALLFGLIFVALVVVEIVLYVLIAPKFGGQYSLWPRFLLVSPLITLFATAALAIHSINKNEEQQDRWRAGQIKLRRTQMDQRQVEARRSLQALEALLTGFKWWLFFGSRSKPGQS